MGFSLVWPVREWRTVFLTVKTQNFRPTMLMLPPLFCASVLLACCALATPGRFHVLHLDIVSPSHHNKAVVLTYNTLPVQNTVLDTTSSIPLQLECIDDNTHVHHYPNMLYPVNNSSKTFPRPVLVAAHQSARLDPANEKTRGMYIVANEAPRSDPTMHRSSPTNWSTCRLINLIEVIPVPSISSERTVRIMWTDDIEDDVKEIVDPMYFSLKTAQDVDASILQYAKAQIETSIPTPPISFAELLEVEADTDTDTDVEASPCSDSSNQQQCKNNQIANELWHRVTGLFHSNVSAPKIPIDAIESQRPCVCVDPTLSDCISFPGHMKGDTTRLGLETVNGNYAAVVSSNNNLFATPNAPGEKIVVYGATNANTNLQHAIWIDGSIFYGSASFETGERIDLRGFLNEGNKGIFEIKQIVPNVKNNESGVKGILIVLDNILPSSAEPGYVKYLKYEANKNGGVVTGCFGQTVGPATANDPIVIYGGNSNHQYLIRFSPVYTVSKYEVGELIRLQHFQSRGNQGVFRILAVQQHVLEITNIKNCAATNLMCDNTIDTLIKESKKARKIDMRIKRPFHCPLNCYGHGRMEAMENHQIEDKQHQVCSCDEGFDPNNCCKTRLNQTIAVNDIHCPTAMPTEVCSGHGLCNGISGVCGCENSWMSSDCSVPVLPCPNACSAHGVCETSSGLCHCDDAWSGLDCSKSNVFCPLDCCGLTHGVCNHDTGRCTCHAGYAGMDCCSASLPCCQGCSSHGTCDDSIGQCTCDKGWGGDFSECCSKKLCPKDCYSDEKHGRCVDGVCNCQPSFTGVACEISVLPCPNNCSGHGNCDFITGDCTCQIGWRGIDCGIPYVPCNCSLLPTAKATNRSDFMNRFVAAFGSHTLDAEYDGQILDATVEDTVGGVCDTTTGLMKCKNHSFVGRCCSRIPCFNDCTHSLHHGKCDEETSLCVCSRAWMGADCSIPKCGQHGILLSDGSCRADKHYYSPIQGGICDRVGPLCRPDNRCVADQSPSDTCSNNAVGCSHVGACMCKMGWTGVTCENRLEPTGEQNFKNYKQTRATLHPDKEMSLHKSVYLIYSEARFPLHPQPPSLEDFQVVFNLLGYSSQLPLEILSDSKTILKRGDIDGDSKIQFNEFIKLCFIPEQPFVDLVPKAIAYVFRMLDYDSDAAVSFQDIAMSVARSLAIQKWNSIVSFHEKNANNKDSKLNHDNRELPKSTLSLGIGSMLQGSKRCKMKKNPCDIVTPGDWLSINGRDYDVYEVQFFLFLVLAFLLLISQTNEINAAVSHTLFVFLS